MYFFLASFFCAAQFLFKHPRDYHGIMIFLFYFISLVLNAFWILWSNIYYLIHFYLTFGLFLHHVQHNCLAYSFKSTIRWTEFFEFWWFSLSVLMRKDNFHVDFYISISDFVSVTIYSGWFTKTYAMIILILN